MAAFAILRTTKLKTAASIRGAGGHNSRIRPTSNAAPMQQQKNRIMVDGGKDLYQTVMKKIEAAGVKRKIRRDAVLAQEVFLSASPEFFRPDDPSRAGIWDQQKMETWQERAAFWLEDQFDDNVIDCRLHLDESTPHIHAIVVPLIKDEKGVKLSAKEVFSKKTLRDMQTSYARATEKLGLQRGLVGSKARHTTVRKFYAAANRAASANVPQIPTPPKMFFEKVRQEFADSINKKLSKQFSQIVARANFAVLANKKKNEYQRTALALAADLEIATLNIKDVPLSVVLDQSGLEMYPDYKNQFIGCGHRISVKNQKWYDHNAGAEGVGAIDLVMHLYQYDFKHAIAWIGQEIDTTAAARAIRAQAQVQANRYTAETDLAFIPPHPIIEHLPALKKWLTEEKGIDQKLIDDLIETGKIYATEKKGHINAVFLTKKSKRVTGAEIEGLSNRLRGMARGSKRKAGAWCIGEVSSKHAVWVESALDAISYKQLHSEKQCYVISTAGATTAPQFFDQLVASGWSLTIAYNNNETGRVFAEKIKEKYEEVEIEFSKFTDWNDDLINFNSDYFSKAELDIGLSF